MIHFLIFAVAGGWHFETQRDPLGQPVYVAEVAPDEARPHIALRFLCGGLSGVVFRFNTGDMQLAGMLGAPAAEGVRFDFESDSYETTAERAAIADGIGTFEIKGSEAFHVAGLMRQSGNVAVNRRKFPLDGAQGAIGDVLDMCPFKP